VNVVSKSEQHAGPDPGDDAEEGATARASRKEATQARILRASMELFARRGFEATSITAIAAHAGVSRGAVFWHFGSKAALFKEACNRFFVPFWREFERTLDGPAHERVFLMLEAYERFVASNRETIAAFVRWVLESQTMRESLQGELLALHGLFFRKLTATLAKLEASPAQAEQLSLGLLSLLAGNLLFDLIDHDEKLGERRRESLRAIAGRLLAAVPDGRRPAR
jgi:AcrR family transcriptional regulator